jgi:hypothetical protein
MNLLQMMNGNTMKRIYKTMTKAGTIAKIIKSDEYPRYMTDATETTETRAAVAMAYLGSIPPEQLKADTEALAAEIRKQGNNTGQAVLIIAAYLMEGK